MLLIIEAFFEGVWAWLVAGREDGRLGWGRVAFLVFLVALVVIGVIQAIP